MIKKKLLLYWSQIDLTDPDGQFHDRSSQYRTAIFYQNEQQKQLSIEASGRLVNRL